MEMLRLTDAVMHILFKLPLVDQNRQHSCYTPSSLLQAFAKLDIILANNGDFRLSLTSSLRPEKEQLKAHPLLNSRSAFHQLTPENYSQFVSPEGQTRQQFP